MSFSELLMCWYLKWPGGFLLSFQSNMKQRNIIGVEACTHVPQPRLTKVLSPICKNHKTVLIVHAEKCGFLFHWNPWVCSLLFVLPPVAMSSAYRFSLKSIAFITRWLVGNSLVYHLTDVNLIKCWRRTHKLSFNQPPHTKPAHRALHIRALELTNNPGPALSWLLQVMWSVRLELISCRVEMKRNKIIHPRLSHKYAKNNKYLKDRV